MRYIKKSDTEPQCLADYKTDCKKAGVPEPLLYKDFNRTGELRSVLCCEQHNVCCYCQRPVKGFRIEHSYPENGPYKAVSEKLQLDYSNLFASCIDSERQPKEFQHCDVSKGNKIIREFIKEAYCQRYFKYLSTGEIVPNGTYNTLKEYNDSTTLTKDEKDALEAITVLNLNCHALVEERKECLYSLLGLLCGRSKDEWKVTMKNWLASDTYPSFIELRFQYLNAYLVN